LQGLADCGSSSSTPASEIFINIYNMEYIKIIGVVCTILGTILIYFSDSIQLKTDRIFKDKVSEYVENQKKINAPIIEVLRIEGVLPKLFLIVKNVGDEKAYNVSLVYSERSSPSSFVANPISLAREIPRGVEYILPMNIFSGIDMILKQPNSEPGFKEKLITYMEEYKKGTKSLIPRFNIEYHDKENNKSVSDTYYFIIDGNQIRGLNKED
jgi:hypothetical protein